LAPSTVEAEERPGRDGAVELGAIGQQGRAEAVEHFDRQAARVLGRLQHHRRHGADQHDLGHRPGLARAT
jgi:hypothetical protein